MDSDDFLCLDSLASLLLKAMEHDLDVLRFDYKYVNEEGYELDKNRIEIGVWYTVVYWLMDLACMNVFIRANFLFGAYW